MRLSLPFLILIITFSFILFSCDKDEVTPLTTSSIISLETVTATFSGTVMNTDNRVVSGVEISAGNSSTFTDAQGNWTLENVSVPKDRAYIKASHNGYLHGSKTLLVSEGSTYEIDLTLLFRGRIGSVGTQAGGTITLSSGQASLTFSPEAFLKLDGSTYEGEVLVYAQYIDPTTPQGFATMPGDLVAINADDENVGLQSFGMLGVELRGSDGTAVMLNPATPATIRLEVPASLLSSAPVLIPLWHFDEEIGVWKEEGEATLMGDRYIGEVSHFSWWNCDLPIEFVRLCGQAVSDTGISIRATGVVNSVNYGTRSTITNSMGEFCGIVPAGENLTLTIYNLCGDSTVIDLGSLSVNTDLGQIIVGADIEITTFTGTLTSCSGTPLQGITVGMQRVDNTAYQDQGKTDQNGSYSIEVNTCNSSEDSIRLVFLDEDNVQALRTPFTALPTTSNDLGTMEMCLTTELVQFYSINLDGNIYICPGASQLVYQPDSPNGFGLDFYGCGSRTGVAFSDNKLRKVTSNSQHRYDEGVYTLADTSASDATRYDVHIYYRNGNSVRISEWQSGQVEILRTPRFQRDTTIAKIQGIGIPLSGGTPLSYSSLIRGYTVGSF